MNKTKLTQEQQKAIEEIQSIGNRLFRYKYPSRKHRWKYKQHECSASPYSNTGTDVAIDKQGFDDLINEGLLTVLGEENPACFVLTDVARAHLANQSVEDFHNDRLAKARELLSERKTRKMFQKIIDLLVYSEKSSNWDMLFDYVNQQLNDWPDEQRMYDFERCLEVVPQEAHRLTRVRFISSVSATTKNKSFFETSTERVFIESWEFYQTNLHKFIGQHGKSWKHVELREPHAKRIIEIMDSIPEGFFENIESFRIHHSKSASQRTWMYACAQEMTMALTKIFRDCERLKLVDLSQAVWSIPESAPYINSYKFHLEMLAPEVLLPVFEQDK